MTKYRQGVRIGDHLDLLDTMFAAVCAHFGAALVASNERDDHVHLLIEYPPTAQLSTLVNSLKGVSSR